MDVTTWDCLSCGARAQHKPFCEQCGAARPVEGEDSALSLMLGLVCERCDGYNDPGVDICASCGAPLGADLPAVGAVDAIAAPVHLLDSVVPELEPEPMPDTETALPAVPVPLAPVVSTPAEPPQWMTAPVGKPLATAFAMPKIDLAAVATRAEGAGVAAPQPPPQTTAPAVPNAVPRAAPPCVKCGTQLSVDDKFCRNCGTRVGDGAPVVSPPVGGSPMMTTQIAAVKMPGPGLPSPVLNAQPNATLVMPAMRMAQSAASPSATMVFGAVAAERSAKLVLVRGMSQFGSQWRLQAGETVVGRSQGGVLFPDDDALAARHCRLVFRGADLWLEPEQTTNGVFLRVRDRARLVVGDEIVVGAQRLRVLADEDRPVRVASDPSTRILGSMVKAQPPIALLRVAPDPSHNEVFFRSQRLLTMGRNNCDLNFPRDSFVSERHAQISVDDEGLLLEDLRSRNGTYVRIRKPVQLQHGDLVLLGDKVLRIELPR